MSNRNSSTRSQRTNDGAGNANSSSKIENRRTCYLSWNIDNLSRLGWPSGKISSPIFSSADDDLKWYLEFSSDLDSPNGRISRLLKLDHENGFFNEYNAISGDAELTVIRGIGNGHVKKSKQKFEIQYTGNTQVLPCIRFPEIVDHSSIWDSYGISQSNPLRIACKVSYETTKIETYENPTSDLSDDLKNLFTDKEFSDVIIKVKSKEYPVYKGILATRSPVFKAMFRENNGMIENTTNVVTISDFTPEVIEQMLLFIYTGKVEKLEKLVYELLRAANKYQLEKLIEMCEDELFKQLSKDNVIKILILAHEHNASWLKTEALKFVKSNSRYADLKKTKIWKVLTSYNDLMEDLIAVLLDE